MRKVLCPHCNAVNESYGWTEHSRCISCNGEFEINLEDSSEGIIEKITERLDGIFDDTKKDAKFID